MGEIKIFLKKHYCLINFFALMPFAAIIYFFYEWQLLPSWFNESRIIFTQSVLLAIQFTSLVTLFFVKK
jgi:hypothetical protein